MLRDLLKVGAIVALPLLLVSCGSASSDGAPKSSTQSVAPSDQPTFASGAPEVTFPDPDAAITYFIDALKSSDGTAALRAFSIKRRVEGYSFEEFAKLAKRTQPFTDVPPLQYQLYRAMATNGYISKASQGITTLVISLVLPPSYSIHSNISFETDETRSQDIADFVKLVDPNRLSTIKIVRIGRPDPKFAEGDKARSFGLRVVGVYGGDDIQDRSALVDIDGTTFVIGFKLIRYGKEWQIFNIGSAITNDIAEAKRMTEEEYKTVGF